MPTMFKSILSIALVYSICCFLSVQADWFDDDTNIYHNSALSQINEGGNLNVGDLTGPTLTNSEQSGGAGGVGGTTTITNPSDGTAVGNGGGGGGGGNASAMSNIQGSGNGQGGSGGNSAISQNETTIIKRPLPPAPPLINNQVVPYGSDAFNIGVTSVFGGGQIGFTKVNSSTKAVNFANASKVRAQRDSIYVADLLRLQDCDSEECFEMRSVLLEKLKKR